MNDEDIMTLIRAGGRATNTGIRALFDGSAQAMLRFFVHQGVPPGDAEDVLQETFLKIAVGARGYSGHGKAQSWFWQVARNCLTDYLRKKAKDLRRHVPFDDEHDISPDSPSRSDPLEAMQMTAQECFADGLDRFAKEHADRAFALTLHMDGASIESIAATIGRSATATKQYLSQCRKKLQPYVARCTELLTG